MSEYDLNNGVIDKVTISTEAAMLTATRTIAGYAKDSDDLYDLMDVLGITKHHLVLGLLEVENNLKL